jgi:hypothetical protein
LIQELNFSHNAAARLNWYLSVVRLVEPAPLGNAVNLHARLHFPSTVSDRKISSSAPHG